MILSSSWKIISFEFGTSSFGFSDLLFKSHISCSNNFFFIWKRHPINASTIPTITPFLARSSNLLPFGNTVLNTRHPKIHQCHSYHSTFLMVWHLLAILLMVIYLILTLNILEPHSTVHNVQFSLSAIPFSFFVTNSPPLSNRNAFTSCLSSFWNFWTHSIKLCSTSSLIFSNFTTT